MQGIPVDSLVIGIASSPAERRQLARLLGGSDAFLIVSTVRQAREFLGVVETTPAVIPQDGPVLADAAQSAAALGPAPRSAAALGPAPRSAAALGPAPQPAAVLTEVAPSPQQPPPDLAVDSDRRVLRWRDQEIDLTRLEHDVLLCLVDAPGQIWTYERLHLEVWGNRHLGRGSDMHSVVRRVRGKLARLNAATTIHSVRGVGFRLAPV
ncbi:winged helix-turn-helix domain-containing protein [Micromonospora sp. WMMD1155]|uniref:winged helix-turn-helix domain-containing protein n=1 Tax=Micromonospora sp. WMMD1155 TaxID=3016094 RepID=UPI00249BDA0A|nr:winged helix-turn-helix domain-containing protein [Micromonospora sp. WMMD1155]WFE53686.1 winged helix-turn-helix domain-containing protein [Micromonospora sp. WMMD1155]